MLLSCQLLGQGGGACADLCQALDEELVVMPNLQQLDGCVAVVSTVVGLGLEGQGGLGSKWVGGEVG